jgi:hypothetical protein
MTLDTGLTKGDEVRYGDENVQEMCIPRVFSAADDLDNDEGLNEDDDRPRY